MDRFGLDQAMGRPRLTHGVRGRAGALATLPGLRGEAVGGATKFSDRLDFDLDADLDYLGCGNAEISGRALRVALMKANSASRQTHIPGTCAVGMIISRPM